jgi:hypothetical protein
MWRIYRSVAQIFERPQPALEDRVPLLTLPPAFPAAAPTPPSPKAITASSVPPRSRVAEPSTPPLSPRISPAGAPSAPAPLTASPAFHGPLIKALAVAPPPPSPKASPASAPVPPLPSPLTASPTLQVPIFKAPAAASPPPSPKASPAKPPYRLYTVSPAYKPSPAAILSAPLPEISEQSRLLDILRLKSQVPTIYIPFSSHTTSPALSLATSTNLRPNEPWIEMINREFDAIAEGVTERYGGTLNITPDASNERVFKELEKNGHQEERMEISMRSKWQDQIRKSSDLVRKAAAEMLALFADLQKATQHIQNQDARYARMAELLMNDPTYSYRFYPENQKTLLFIYRFIRGMIYIVHCPHVNHDISKSKKIYFLMTLTQADVTPYGNKGTEEYEMRENYNEVIKTYAFLRPYLTGQVIHLLVPDNGTLNFEITPRIDFKSVPQKKEHSVLKE